MLSKVPETFPNLRGDEDVGVDADGAQPPQRVEAPVGLRRVLLLGHRVGRLLGHLERLQQLPLHGGGAARQGEIKTLAPRRRLSLSSVWRGGGGEERKEVGFVGEGEAL
uniref:Pco108434 n=1 Tax=Arundo donax TaxID=35708 RepID=A0A0A9DYX3_ARUDO